jgi:transposase
MLPVLVAIACGLDVHKRFITACLLKTGASGEVQQQLRTFKTTTADLRRLAQWLQQEGCQHVAMESTGVYWKPVFNILEGVCAHLLLVNAQHIKNVPGRKTDSQDAEWIATLLRAGLLRGSFIPPPEIRELRELTRYRSTLVRLRADECNRIQKLLENANIKLASVATDVLGKSGKEMLHALCRGEDDPEVLAQLARGRLRAKIPQLIEALEGHVSASNRWLLKLQLERVAELEDHIAGLDTKIAELSRPFEPLLEMLDKIPGINRRIAQIIVAEIGVDMSRFPTARHLSSWSGMCPGQHESGGKRGRGKTRKGCSWLRAALMEAAWAAGHCKKNAGYLTAQYQRLAKRRGRKRACVGVGHSILCIVHSLLSKPRDYQDLGQDYFLKRRGAEKTAEALVSRLHALGYEVQLKKLDEPNAA